MLPGVDTAPQCKHVRLNAFVGLGARGLSVLHPPGVLISHSFEYLTRPFIRLLTSCASIPSARKSCCLPETTAPVRMFRTSYISRSFGWTMCGSTTPRLAKLITTLHASDLGIPAMGDGRPRSALGFPLAFLVAAAFADAKDLDFVLTLSHLLSALVLIFALVAVVCSVLKKEGLPFLCTNKLITRSLPRLSMASAINSCSSLNTSFAPSPGRENTSHDQHSRPSSLMSSSTTLDDVKYVFQKHSGVAFFPNLLPMYTRPDGV